MSCMYTLVDTSTIDLDSLIKINNNLIQENILFETYISKHHNNNEDIDQNLNNDMISSLSIDEKNDIITKESDEIQAQIKSIEDETEKKLSMISSRYRHLDMQMSDLKLDILNFKKEVIYSRSSSDNYNNMHQFSIQKIHKYHQNKINRLKSNIDKIKFKNEIKKKKISKFTSDLKKKELGESLNIVDFQYLQIENKQLLSQITEKNKELIHLKKAAGKAVQNLNILNNDLKLANEKSLALEKSMEINEKNINNYDDNIKKLVKQKEKAREFYLDMKFNVEDIDQPKINDYLKLKSEVSELENKISDLERKNKISDMEIKRLTCILNQN